MKKLILYLLVLLMLIPPAQADQPRLTLMIYMTGSNLESEYFAATSDIQEMIASRYNQKEVTVLIMTGGSEKWWMPGISAEHLSIHRIERARLVLEKDYPLESMASPNPLTALLDYGYTHYPAEQYALIIWDHGSGPVNGVCMDTLFGGDMLLPAELNAALAASPFGEDNKLEWIGFDACLMANAETAALLAPYARYMIASQETEPGRGWDYAFLKGIELDADGAETGRRIIDLYYTSAQTHTPGNNITLSLLDLNRMPAVCSAVDSLFGALNMLLTKDNFSDLSLQRQRAAGVGRAATSEADYDLVDLRSLTGHYAAHAPDEAAALISALDEAVIYSRSNVEGLSGLSVYHPYYNKYAYLNQWRADYRAAAPAPGYLRYLDTYTGIWLGSQLTSWKGMTPAAEPDPGGYSQTISLQLTASQVQNFASAELLVLYASEKTGYGFIYREAINPPDENGMLRISYSGRQLVQVDEDGHPLEDGLSYYLQGDHIVLAGGLSRYSKGPMEHKTLFLHFRPREDGSLEFLYMEELLDNGMLNTRHNINLDDWEYYEVLYDNRVPTVNAEGDLLPFEQWDDSAWYLWKLLELDSGLHFRFSSAQTGSNDLVALIQITDTQGNIHTTPLVPLQHLKAVAVDVPDQLLLDDERCTMLLTGYEVVASDLQPVIKLRVCVTNKTAEPLLIGLDTMLLNRCVPTAYPGIDLANDGIAPGSTADVLISIPLSALEQVRTAAVDELVLYGYTENEDWDSELPFATLPLALDFDFSAVITLPEEPQVLAGCEQDGVTIELLALRTDSADTLLADVRVTNRTGKDIHLSLEDYRINRFKGVFTSSAIDLPAGCSGYKTVRFVNTLSLTPWGTAAFCGDLLSAMQIPSVHSLSTTWHLTTGDDTVTRDFVFPLTQAYAYAEDRHDPMGEPLDRITLYEDDSLCVQLAGFATSGNSINVVLLYENTTGTDRQVKWTHAGANGVADDYLLLSDVDLPANTVMLSYLDVTPDGLDAELPGGLTDVCLGMAVFGADGSVLQRDSYRIDVCSPPAENGCFYAGHLSMTLLSREVTPFTPLAAKSLPLPENAADYHIRLVSPAEPDAVSAQAHIVLMQSGYIVPLVSGIPLQQSSDGTWQADYNGLYVGLEEGSSNFWAAEQAVGDTWSLGMIAAYPLGYDSINQRNTALTFTSGGAALDVTYGTPFPEAINTLYTYARVYVPQRDDAGRLYPLPGMPQKQNTMYVSSYDLVPLPAAFRLLPVAAYPGDMYILYSFTYPDGSGCSAEPVPYPPAGK